MIHKKNSVSQFRLKEIRRLRERLEELKRQESQKLLELTVLLGDGQKVLVANEKIIVIGRHCYKRFYPWKETIRGIWFRCSEKILGKRGANNYFGKGILCEIVDFEIEDLYFRDKAYLMATPSIDRINPHDHYRKDNCRFLEKSENSRRANKNGGRPKKNCNLPNEV